MNRALQMVFPTLPAVAVGPLRHPRFDFKKKDRTAIYDRLRLSREQRQELEAAIADSSSRTVGKGALDNVIAKLPERKCQGDVRLVESNTVERFYALQLELDDDVLAYYPQVPMRDVIWQPSEQRKRLRTNPTLDFLVFRRGRIAFVEAKTEEELIKLSEGTADAWYRLDSRWGHTPLENRANTLGITFEPFVQATGFGTAMQTLEAMAGIVDAEIAHGQRKLVTRVLTLLRRGPRTIQSLIDQVPTFNSRLALWMLARQQMFGLIRSRPFDDAQNFWVYSDRATAESADQAVFESQMRGYQQPDVHDAYLAASRSDQATADGRLITLEQIAKGLRVSTKHYDRLAKTVTDGLTEGKAPLEVLLGGFSRCGNTDTRLGTTVEKILLRLIKNRWDKGKAKTITQLHGEVETQCEARGLLPPSYKTVRLWVLRQGNPRRRALTTGGMRGYAAVRERSDPLAITLPPLGYLHTLIIDSSDFDLKVRPDALLKLLPEKPRFYLGIDSCSKKAVAHALIFGSARTDGLAILLRDFVHRHGYLPLVIQSDRGPEHTSDWLKEFCRVKHITLLYAPTAGSTTNGAVENVIGQVNKRVARYWTGSTTADALGRKVDGRFKSKRNAVHSFETIHREFTEFLYEVYNDTPQGLSDEKPNDVASAAIARLGRFGRKQYFDHAFIIQTSVSIDLLRRFRERKGLWWNYALYASDSLLRAARLYKLEEIRYDCVDPSVIYAKLGAVWCAVFRRDVQQFLSQTPDQRLYALLDLPSSKAETRKHKRIQAKKLMIRLMDAERAAVSTRHLHPCHAVAAPVKNLPRRFPRLDLSQAELLAA